MIAEDGRKSEPKRKLASQRFRATPQEILKALNHPLRRRILRTLHEAGEARSPNEVHEKFDLAVGAVSYHFKVLRECGAVVLTDTRPARGATEHFYASLVSGNEVVITILGFTEKEDRL